MREHIELLKDHADVLANHAEVGLGRCQFVAVDDNLAGGDGFQQVQTTKERTFSRARGSDHADDLILLDGAIDSLEHLQLSEVLAQAFNCDDGTHTNLRSYQRPTNEIG